MPQGLTRGWGDATAALHEDDRRRGWIDLVFLFVAAGALLAVVQLARTWAAPLRPHVAIDLSIGALPRYTLLSLSRGLVAYVISLGFTLVYGYWAAKDRRAERVLVPLLDVLQSIPVLGFMPGVVLGLVAAFPARNLGLELAVVIMIFTGQAWNMTFSFYESVRTVPLEQREVAMSYRFGWWQRFRWVEVPFATIGLVYNSMMSMAGGWFFLMISEAFVLGDHDFRLPGLGSYMSVAVARHDGRAIACGILAMVLMIVALDQLLWRPVVVWARKFRVDEATEEEEPRSWFLELVRRSHVHRWLESTKDRQRPRPRVALARGERRSTGRRFVLPPRVVEVCSVVALTVLAAVLLAASVRGYTLVRGVSLRQWLELVGAGGATLGRVLASTAVGTAWALPVGLAIGLDARRSRIFQPLAQIMASFPAPMLFPLVVLVLQRFGISLGLGSILLMLLGTQWYILFNVTAGATAIPSDLREAARSYGITGYRRFRALYLPAVFPHLVTGWVTAAGGAWNASIVSEHVTSGGQILSTFGLGAAISSAAEAADLRVLAASVLVMSTIVVLWNRTVWRSCHRLAATRFSMTR